jgi:hypothetical protein
LLRAYLADSVVLSSGCDGLLTFPLTMRQWFFDIDIFAGFHRPDSRQAVPVIARCDDDCINSVVFQQVAQIGIPLCLWISFFRCRNSTAIRVTQSRNLDAVNFVKHPHQLVRSPATADESEIDFFIGAGGE